MNEIPIIDDLELSHWYNYSWWFWSKVHHILKWNSHVELLVDREKLHFYSSKTERQSMSFNSKGPCSIIKCNISNDPHSPMQSHTPTTQISSENSIFNVIFNYDGTICWNLPPYKMYLVYIHLLEVGTYW